MILGLVLLLVLDDLQGNENRHEAKQHDEPGEIELHGKPPNRICLVKKILNLIVPAVSSRPNRFLARTLWTWTLCLFGACALLWTAGPAWAGVIWIGPTTYRLDNGPAMTGMWEIAEKLAYTKDAAVVVVEPKAPSSLVQPMLQLLESLKVPTALIRQADYKALLDRGVLHPTTTP